MQIDWVLIHRLTSQMILLGGLIAAFTLCQGCAETGNAFQSLERRVSAGEDKPFLEKGFAAYENGDTIKAAAIFQNLYDNTGSMEIRQHALFGLSISRLWGAKTVKEFDEARNLWQKWRQLREINTECEDPAYLEPFLMCKFPFPESKEEGVELTNNACSEKVPRYQYNQAQNKTKNLEASLKILEKKYNALKAEKDSLVRAQFDKDATIQTLKEKIKALEDIDQKIQEKKNKTEISSPE